jgi:hypothetical protein
VHPLDDRFSRPDVRRLHRGQRAHRIESPAEQGGAPCDSLSRER